MSSAEQTAMNLLIHTLVEKVDAMGLGVELMEHLGEERTRVIMDCYKEHERVAGQE